MEHPQIAKMGAMLDVCQVARGERLPCRAVAARYLELRRQLLGQLQRVQHPARAAVAVGAGGERHPGRRRWRRRRRRRPPRAHDACAKSMVTSVYTYGLKSSLAWPATAGASDASSASSPPSALALARCE
mmetsp:Transcript_54163/g.132776  ORF Transcript_54163/g.132776 Transcript_54163/m.132776 type:complete len:130 (+) Transcript_54163:347-736(+)